MRKLVILVLAIAFSLNVCACTSVSEKTTTNTTVSNNENMTLKPLYEELNMEKLPDGIYNVSFEIANIELGGTASYINTTIYTKDLYDTVDLHNLKAGDKIERSGRVEDVTKVVWDEQKSNMCINYWDSVDDAEEVFVPNGGGTYVIKLPDDHNTYTERGKAKVKLAEKCVLKDSSDLENPNISVNGMNDVIFYIQESDNHFTVLNTTMKIENGKCTEINRHYIP